MPENEISLKCSQEVAKLLKDPTVRADRVLRVIEETYTKGILLHGVKHLEDFESIKEHGVLPKTPEGGNVSCWATGKRIFSSSPAGPLFGYDTPFFHYGHSRSSDGEKIGLFLVATTKDLLSGLYPRPRINIETESVAVGYAVPEKLIQIMIVTTEDFNNLGRMRLEGLKILEELITLGVRPGMHRVFTV